MGGVIDLVVVGRARGPLADAAAEYERRLGRYCTLSVRELKEEPVRPGDRAAAIERERRRVAPLVDGAWLVALDASGSQLSSEELADFVREREETAPQRTAFVIGGPQGLAPELVRDARTVLSLGRATLPHQLARVVLGEALYRAFTILRNEPYHR
ncbi:MAG: rRNA (pseudouridine1915-N3)-methyltransferase [Gaiellales bacterium]|nr:rRNA (pseudouridine1915-N3)-methyltransferase [Gaiellales bacterium]